MELSRFGYFLRGLFCLILIGILSLTSADPGNTAESASQQTVNRIIISLEDFQLLAFEGNRLVGAYPIATGADTAPTPTGEFEIVNKLKHPWYTPDDKPAKAPGPNNPLGSRWMGIDKPSYGIHGTRSPKEIGSRASEGCIRLFNMHVEELYDMIKIGARVIVKESLSPTDRQIVNLKFPDLESSS